MQLPLTHTTKIVAHRGASYKAPENTIASFKLAFEEYADFIEGDFWMTKDNEIVCIHDPHTKRVTNKKIKLNVISSTLHNLKQLDVGSWKGSEFEGSEIPTIQEIFKMIPAGKGIFIDVKDDREIFMQKLAEIIEQSFIPEDMIRIIAFNPNTVQLAKKYLPDIKAYWLFGWYFSKIKYIISLAQRKLIKALNGIECDGVDLYAAPYIDEKLVKYLRYNDLDFCAYNVDKQQDALKLITLGADAITTDSPFMMRGVMEELGKDKNVFDNA